MLLLIAVDLSNGISLRVTASHAFWADGCRNLSHPGWVEAGQLLPGDELRTADGQHVTVVAIHWNEGEAHVYTLTVANDHTFFVGAAQVLMHNAGICRIDPNTVRFSQESASSMFKNGEDIDQLAAGLRNGTIKPDSIPAIRLVEQDGLLFTLDNRRLAAFQEAGVEVPYRMATPREIAANLFKFTSKNNGTSIRIRGRK